MLLGEILHEGVIKTRLEAEDKYEAIEELVDLLVESHELPLQLRDHVAEVVITREKAISTGMEAGVALPHGATDRIPDIIGAMGLSRAGVPFDSLDGKPARIVILLVLPVRNFTGHVRTMAGIAHLLRNEPFRLALQEAASVEEVLRLIEEQEDKDLFVEHRHER